MALRRTLLALQGALLLGLCRGSWHKLRRYPHGQGGLRAFDRSVLGNLKDAGEVANPRMSRSHMFVADITVGTPPQTLSCLLDSASADIWVPSTRCRNCESKHAFRTDRSETFMPAIVHTPHGDMPVPVEVDDSGGQIVGFIVQDRVGLGPWVFNNQSFLIVEESNLPGHRAWDGICGLGWKGLSSSVEPLYSNLMKHDGYAAFALVPSGPGSSYLVVGEVPNRLHHTVAWAPADPVEAHGERSFWSARGRIGVRGWTRAARFVVDTGTSFILAPRREYAKFLRRLLPRKLFDHLCGADPASDNLIVCDCAVISRARSEFSVYLGGQRFSLPVARLFKRVPTTDGGQLCLLHVQQNAMTSVSPLDLLNALLGGGLGAAPGSPKGGPAGAAAGAGGPSNPLPGLVLPPFLMPAGGSPQVEEITETRPDGRVCTTTLVWVRGDLKENRTRCQERRLQAPFEDPLGEMWVLGGAFLEHFVTVLDFEQKQLGFGKLDDENTSPLEARFMRPPHKQPTVPHVAQRRFDAPPPSQHSAGGGGASVLSALILGVMACGIAGCAAVLSRKMRTRKDLTQPVQQEEGDGGAELWEEADNGTAVAE